MRTTLSLPARSATILRVFGVAVFLGASTASAAPPPHLAALPTVETIRSEIGGWTELDTAARQAGALIQLSRLVSQFSKGGEFGNDKTLEERALQQRYADAWREVAREAKARLERDGAPAKGRNSAQARWGRYLRRYDNDAMRAELVYEFLPEDLVRRYEADYPPKKYASLVIFLFVAFLYWLVTRPVFRKKPNDNEIVSSYWSVSFSGGTATVTRHAMTRGQRKRWIFWTTCIGLSLFATWSLMGAFEHMLNPAIATTLRIANGVIAAGLDLLWALAA